MKIKKLGHCCLLIDTDTARILTDPGTYSTGQNEITGINIVLITHEHQDHFHIDSLKKVLANNPTAKVITNASVGKLLTEAAIEFELVSDGGTNDAHGATIEAYGHKHAVIYKMFGQVENTGFFIDGKLFYPGDAFTDPGRPVDILALPVAGPWMKIGEAVEYAAEVRPRIAIPVHDGIMKTPGFMYGMLESILTSEGVTFVPMFEHDEKEL